MANDDDRGQNEKNNTGLAKRISFYTVAVAFICIFIFGYIIADGPPFRLFLETEAPNSNMEAYHRLGLFLLVLFSGAFGGCLYNFRGIKKHLEDNDFVGRYTQSYLLRPISAAMCGVFVFFLVLSGVLVMSVGDADLHSKKVKSIMLYVAISMLAGYGSHEFLKKVKDIMKTVFALSEQEKNKTSEGKSTSRRKG